MAGIEMQNVVLIALVLLIVVFVVYQYNPSFFRFMRRGEGFVDAADAAAVADDAAKKAAAEVAAAKMAESKMAIAKISTAQEAQGFTNQEKKEPFADLSSYEGPASFGSAEAPAGCYPRDQLTPAELLPKDMNSIWAEQNPMGPGSLKGKNFLSAGALIGVNTVGQSLRNANLQIRSEPPNPQVPVSIFLQSTIGPDISHRSLEIN
jgi:hypothetical protein